MKMTTKIPIKGDVMNDMQGAFYDYYGMPATHPQAIDDALKEANGDDVVLDIASNGGDVSSASTIYTSLRDYSGKVTAHIQGMAASAASIIAMSADTIEMSPTAIMMIHKCSVNGGITGNSDDLRQVAQAMDETDKAIAESYMAKTGLSMGDLLNMMTDETWMSARTAADKGFADSVMFDDGENATMSNALESDAISSEGLNKFNTMLMQIKDLKNTAPEPTTPESELEDKHHKELLKAKLAIING